MGKARRPCHQQFLNISGRQLPWGNAERNAEITKLMAEHQWYGPGSDLVNLAPDDVHNPSAVRLCHPFVGYSQAPARSAMTMAQLGSAAAAAMMAAAAAAAAIEPSFAICAAERRPAVPSTTLT